MNPSSTRRTKTKYILNTFEELISIQDFDCCIQLNIGNEIFFIFYNPIQC